MTTAALFCFFAEGPSQASVSPLVYGMGFGHTPSERCLHRGRILTEGIFYASGRCR